MGFRRRPCGRRREPGLGASRVTAAEDGEGGDGVGVTPEPSRREGPQTEVLFQVETVVELATREPGRWRRLPQRVAVAAEQVQAAMGAAMLAPLWSRSAPGFQASFQMPVRGASGTRVRFWGKLASRRLPPKQPMPAPPQEGQGPLGRKLGRASPLVDKRRLPGATRSLMAPTVMTKGSLAGEPMVA
jgi:hypothetical protein